MFERRLSQIEIPGAQIGILSLRICSMEIEPSVEEKGVGVTLQLESGFLRDSEPKSVRHCVLLKYARRRVN